MADGSLDCLGGPPARTENRLTSDHEKNILRKMFFSWSDVSRFSVRAGGPPKQSKEPSAIAPTRSGPPCERWEAVARAGKRHRPRPERGQKSRDHSSWGLSNALRSNRQTSRLGRAQIQPVELREANSTFPARLLGPRDKAACPGDGQNNPAAKVSGAVRQPPAPGEGRAARKNMLRRAANPTPTAAKGYAIWDRR